MRYRIFPLALFFSMTALVIFFACRKNETKTSPNAVITDVNAPMDIALAKKYYHHVLRVKQGNIVTSIQMPLPSKGGPNQKTPYWAKAVAGETAKSTYVEVPLFYNQRPTTVIGVNGGSADPSAIKQVLNRSFDRLVIYKNKQTGVVDQRIVTFIPDKDYAANHPSDFSNNHIVLLAADFNGYLKYRKWDGTPLFLLKLQGGKIQKYFSPYHAAGVQAASAGARVGAAGGAKTGTGNKAGAGAPNTKTVGGAPNTKTVTDLECTTYCDYTYVQNCYYTYSGESSYEECDDWELEATDCWTDCQDTGDDGTYDNNLLTGDPCADWGICDQPAPAELYTQNPLCRTSFNFSCETSDCSYMSTNLLGMRFVSSTDPTQINPFNAYIGFPNYVTVAAMNRTVNSPLLGQSETPLQFLNDFVQTKALFASGDIVQKTAPDGQASYYFDNYALGVIATMVSNMAADFTVMQYGAAASVPGNGAPIATWRADFTGIASAFVPGGAQANLSMQAKSNSTAVYGTAANPCP